MPESYKRLFSYLRYRSAPAPLQATIVARIHQAIKRKARMMALGFGTAAVASFAAMTAIVSYLSTSFATSGMYQYLSLLFSGDASVLSYWKELSLSILESLPVGGIICFLFVAAFLLWAAAQTVTVTRRFINYTHNIHI